MKVLIAGMSSWHMDKTAKCLSNRDQLEALWIGNKNSAGLAPTQYKRIWPYHLAMKPFYTFVNGSQIEELMRWHALPLYDLWIKSQSLPETVNVVHGAMGSCTPLFEKAKHAGRRVLRVYESMNGHPTTQYGYWQRECDLHNPSYKLPVPIRIWSRMNREIHEADMVLCPSLYVKDSMVTNGVPEEKCFINPFGVETSIFQPRQILPDHPVFIFVGNMTLRKGTQYLFPAFQEFKNKYPSARLICCGGIRPDFQSAWNYWKSTGIIEHYDYLPHEKLATILQSATAFVLPSLEEGFARSIIEAMGAGLPIIATYESGGTTMINNGIEGIIVRGAAEHDLFNAFVTLWENKELCTSMGQASYKAGAVRNTWQDYADRLIAEYDRRLSAL